jgi:hypothetical protein
MTIRVANVTSAGNTVYTSTGNTAITYLSLCNYNPSGNVTANVYVVPNGNTAGNTTIAIASLGLTSLDTYQLYAGGEKLLLSNGDTIQVQANANTVTAVVSFTSI